jgi:excisionase family DNA binding protein
LEAGVGIGLLPSLPKDGTAPAQESLTVNEAAQLLGVDSFTVLSLIQRGKVMPSRAPSGEITLARSELAKLTGKGR